MSLSALHHRLGLGVVIVAHGKQVAGQRGTYVPTVVALREGSRYFVYALSGGP
ncbi:MAG TPA: hypothetical protein VG708_12570 [Mycobacteriales bacterium]|nr:hypothetical protein [Mycobacteriales bacterium]